MNCEQPKTLAPKPPQPKAPTSQGSANSTNTITINLPETTAQTCAKKEESTASTVVIQPEPLKLSIDTPTDWPAVSATALVGAGSILITYFVAKLTTETQKAQTKANIANFRHKWMEDLRDTTSQLLAKIAMLHYEIKDNPDFMSSSESNKPFGEVLQLEAKILLMLDKSKSYSRETNKLINSIKEALKAKKEDELEEAVNKLTNGMSDILEKAWQDIKDDLGAPRSRSWRRFLTGGSTRTPT